MIFRRHRKKDDSWDCICGQKRNRQNFCPNCGMPKPKKKDTQRKITPPVFREVDFLIIQNGDYHYSLDVKNGILKYQNTIASMYGYMEYPQGYFDEKTSNIDKEGMDEISAAFHEFVALGRLIDEEAVIGDGDCFDVYLRIESGVQRFYFTDKDELGLYVGFNQQYGAFLNLVWLLDRYCVFPQDIPTGRTIPYPDDVLDHLNRSFESVSIDSIIGFKYSATGVFGYVFYDGKNKICSVSSLVVPSPPVTMNGDNLRWISEFDLDSTIIPGQTRYIEDADSHKKKAR